MTVALCGAWPPRGRRELGLMVLVFQVGLGRVRVG